MQTAWSILALALFLTNGSPQDQPEPASPRLKITFKIDDSCPVPEPKATVETPEPDTCSKPAQEVVECREPWQLSLTEAIRVALESADFIRVVGDENDDCLCVCPMTGCLDAENTPIEVACDAAADGASMEFKSDTTALVRSVEQQYWNLYVARVHLGCAERAAEIAEGVIGTKLFDLMSHASRSELADAADRLEELSADVARGVSSVADAELQLRAVMGLPSSETRRIATVSEPTTAWIVHGVKTAVKKAIRAKRKANETEQDRLTIDGPTDSLPELVEAVSADYKSYEKARKLAKADAKRLAHESRLFEKGRSTAGRFLDCVRQQAASVTREAGCLAAYNITLAALGEASGTLRVMRDVVIADEPDRTVSSHAVGVKKDDQARTTSFESAPAASEVPAIPVLPELEPESADQTPSTKASDDDDKKVIFKFSLGGLKCEVRSSE
jgi:hypothetical protein